MELAEDFHTVALACSRTALYVGYVLLVGSVMFVTWLWPEGRVERALHRLIAGGWVLMVIGTVATPMLVTEHAGWSAFGGREGACALIRLALLMLAASFLLDLLRTAGHHRWVASLWILAMIETMVISSDAVGGSWQTVKIVATTGHLLATAAWLGGLLALVSVLVHREQLETLHDVLPRFSYVAIGSVITLVVTGTLHSLAIAGSPRALLETSYGAMLAVKLLVFGLMLLLGNEGRRYAERVAKRRLADIDETASPASVSVLATALGAEFAFAVAILGITALLVRAVPT